MMKLPSEILEKIFCYLEEEDLVQCQLTSKIWYQSSVELLYFAPFIDTYQKTRLYVRTISYSLQLGSYLRSIDVSGLSKTEETEPYLLSIILQNCPNITSIEGSVKYELFWNCISHAASQGQLSRLQVLPVSSCYILPLYISTALLFKDSLVSIDIMDEKLCNAWDYDLTSIDAYQTLQDQISEFKKLKIIEIYYQSKKQLSDFDALINDCHHLKKLKIHLVFHHPPSVIIDSETRIRPCPDIISLDCLWRMIDNDSQLRYIIQKFPNLQYLKVEYPYYQEFKLQRCSSDAILEFLLHAINKIPHFEIMLEIERKDLAFVWEKLVEAKLEYRDFAIDCGSQAGVILDLTQDSLTIIFTTYHSDELEDFSQIDFFTLAGKSTRLLKIPNVSSYLFRTCQSLVTPDESNSLDWLFESLKLFTLLETLTLTDSYAEDMLNSSGLVSQNKNIVTLNLINMREYKFKINFLKYIAVNFPNVKHLYLSFYYFTASKRLPIIIIAMEDSYLESLTWIIKPQKFVFNHLDQIYIRLDTKEGVEFYKNDKLHLLRISEQNYHKNDSAENTTYFEITCQNLKKFTIGSEECPSVYNWCFPISQ